MRALGRRRGEAGFTLIELLIVVMIIGMLASIGFALYVNVQQRGRVGKAQADVRLLISGVQLYHAHTGVLPTNAEGLAILTAVTVNPHLRGRRRRRRAQRRQRRELSVRASQVIEERHGFERGPGESEGGVAPLA